jgi:hypothetical protein
MRAGANILYRACQQPVAAFTLDYDVEISDIMTRFGLNFFAQFHSGNAARCCPGRYRMLVLG